MPTFDDDDKDWAAEVTPDNFDRATSVFHWVPCHDGGVAGCAIQGGIDSDHCPEYIARGQYEGQLHVGKVTRQSKAMLIGHHGHVVRIHSYHVLCGDARRLRWVPFQEIATAVAHGWQLLEGGCEADGSPRYIARIPHHDSLQIGETKHQGGLDGPIVASYTYRLRQRHKEDGYSVLAIL